MKRMLALLSVLLLPIALASNVTVSVNVTAKKGLITGFLVLPAGSVFAIAVTLLVVLIICLAVYKYINEGINLEYKLENLSKLVVCLLLAVLVLVFFASMLKLF